MKKKITCATALLAVVVGFPALAQNPAHAHIGHVADGWRDTPDGMGLLPTAKAEAEIAARHAELAVNSGSLGAIQTHLGHVLHALNPEAVESGPGRGYGMIRAAEGALMHMRLASNADGASDNVKRHGEHVTASTSNVVEWAKAIDAHAQHIREATDESQAREMAREVHATLQKILNGHDENGDGRIGWGPSEGGLAQAETHLGLLKRGEGMS